MLKPRSGLATAAFLAWLALAPRLAASTLPRKAPDFTIHLTNGHEVSLSQFKGKVVALIFILTYCPHCQKTIGFLSKDQKDYGPRGFQVLASAIEDMAAQALPDFLKRFSPPFPVGYNSRMPVIDFLQHPIAARFIMPQLVLVDRQGMIRAQFAGDDPFMTNETQQDANLRVKIEELLKEGAPAGPRRRAPRNPKTD